MGHLKKFTKKVEKAAKQNVRDPILGKDFATVYRNPDTGEKKQDFTGQKHKEQKIFEQQANTGNDALSEIVVVQQSGQPNSASSAAIDYAKLAEEMLKQQSLQQELNANSNTTNSEKPDTTPNADSRVQKFVNESGSHDGSDPTFDDGFSTFSGSTQQTGMSFFEQTASHFDGRTETETVTSGNQVEPTAPKKLDFAATFKDATKSIVLNKKNIRSQLDEFINTQLTNLGDLGEGWNYQYDEILNQYENTDDSHLVGDALL